MAKGKGKAKAAETEAAPAAAEGTTATATAEAPAAAEKFEKQNGVTRPKSGTKTGRIWEISDELSKAAGSPVARKHVLEKAKGEGINAATAATQYGRWRRFYGLGKEAPATDGDVTTES